ncbi:MAG TPA: hypothetical protein VH143_18195, partial [Kofleriaceae bacterium]|nr:hypothetical protein [Kofleriaceae bacterium]
PYCDFDGAVGGTAGECIAVACTPGSIAECSGSDALTCNATGTGYDLDSCALGCSNTGSAHCAYLQPTYLPDACDVAAQGSAIAFSGSGSFDPNLDSNCTAIVPQPGAAEVCIVHYGAIEVGSDAVVTVVGKFGGGRAVAFIADGDLTVDGVIDAGGHVGTSGPGGGTFTSGALPQDYPSDTPPQYDAGGGAGGASVGGAGGENIGQDAGSGVDGGAVNGGLATMNPASLAALVGGASSPLANANPTDATNQSIGGGGGGLELVSCHGTTTIRGTLTAGGGGGGGGVAVGFIILPGFGGGAGGNIVLEGVAVSVLGSVFANGAGGGGGASLENGVSTPGANGSDGTQSDSTPAGGGNDSMGGVGGTGGYAKVDAGHGSFARSTGSGNSNFFPGGGGGSVGFLQTYTPAGVTPTITPVHASPSFQPNGTVQTR